MKATLTTATQLYDANASKVIQVAKHQVDDNADENAHTKRMRVAAEVQEKIRFFKSIGDEQRAESFSKQYADL